MLSDKQLSARGNLQQFSETWDDVRDGDGSSDGEAAEEDGRGTTEDDEVGVGGDREGNDKKDTLEGQRRLRS